MIRNDGFGHGFGEFSSYVVNPMFGDGNMHGNGRGNGYGDGYNGGLGYSVEDIFGDDVNDTVYVTVLIINTDPMTTVYQDHCMQSLGDHHAQH